MMSVINSEKDPMDTHLSRASIVQIIVAKQVFVGLQDCTMVRRGQDGAEVVFAIFGVCQPGKLPESAALVMLIVGYKLQPIGSPGIRDVCSRSKSSDDNVQEETYRGSTNRE